MTRVKAILRLFLSSIWHEAESLTSWPQLVLLMGILHMAFPRDLAFPQSNDLSEVFCSQYPPGLHMQSRVAGMGGGGSVQTLSPIVTKGQNSHRSGPEQ